VAIWDKREPPQVLALVRIGLALVLLYDFLRIGQLGLVDVLFAPAEVGGFPDVKSREPVPELYRWLPWEVGTARLAWGLMVGGAAALALGFLTPVACLLLVLTSAQLAQVLPLGDRGIDMLIRNVLLVLAFSGCGRAWSVDARLFGARAEVPAWPRHLLILQLSLMYTMAGVQKTALAWTPFGDFAALYLILQDPSIARWQFGWLRDWFPMTQLATAATLVFEDSAWLLPLVYWYRHTRTRAGRLRAWFNRVRPLRFWLLLGVLLHLGIASTMALGIFPFAVLALYPCFFHPHELGWGRRSS